MLWRHKDDLAPIKSARSPGNALSMSWTDKSCQDGMCPCFSQALGK